MSTVKLASICAVFGVLNFGGPSVAHDSSQLVGLWKIVSFQIEDVETKALSNVYSEHPFGFMQAMADGRFNAFVYSSRAEAMSLGEQEPTHRGIVYSGEHRLQGNSLILHVDHAWHEGWVGEAPFDMSWDEGRTAIEDVRSFSFERGHIGDDVLSIETRPIPNPNGAGNIIIGRVVWKRVSNWQE